MNRRDVDIGILLMPDALGREVSACMRSLEAYKRELIFGSNFGIEIEALLEFWMSSGL